MKKTDDLSAWRVFVTVARSGTLSAAAKALDVEVSSISRAIGGLERTLGCELVRRNMRPLKLTESGQAALKRMETILRAHDALMEALVNDNRALTGRVRLSSAPGFATRRLVPFIREFTEAHPGISVDIQTGGHGGRCCKRLCRRCRHHGRTHDARARLREPRAQSVSARRESRLHRPQRPAGDARAAEAAPRLHLLGAPCVRRRRCSAEAA